MPHSTGTAKILKYLRDGNELTSLSAEEKFHFSRTHIRRIFSFLRREGLVEINSKVRPAVVRALHRPDVKIEDVMVSDDRKRYKERKDPKFSETLTLQSAWGIRMPESVRAAAYLRAPVHAEDFEEHAE